MLRFIFFASFLALNVAEEHVYGAGYPQHPQQQPVYGGQQQHQQHQQQFYWYGGGYQQHPQQSGGDHDSYGKEKKDDGFKSLTFQFDDIEFDCVADDGTRPCVELSDTIRTLKSTNDAVVTDGCNNKDIGTVSFRCEECEDADFFTYKCVFEFETDLGDFKIDGNGLFQPLRSCDDGNPFDSVPISLPPELCEATVDRKYGGEIKKVTVLGFGGFSTKVVSEFQIPTPVDAEFFVNVEIEKKDKNRRAPYGIVNQPQNQYGYYQQPASFQPPYQPQPAFYQPQTVHYQPQPAFYQPQTAQNYQRPGQVYQQPRASYGQQNSYNQPQRTSTYQKHSPQDYQQKPPAYGVQNRQSYQQIPTPYTKQVQKSFGGHYYNDQPASSGVHAAYNPYQRS